MAAGGLSFHSLLPLDTLIQQRPAQILLRYDQLYKGRFLQTITGIIDVHELALQQLFRVSHFDLTKISLTAFMYIYHEVINRCF